MRYRSLPQSTDTGTGNSSPAGFRARHERWRWCGSCRRRRVNKFTRRTCLDNRMTWFCIVGWLRRRGTGSRSEPWRVVTWQHVADDVTAWSCCSLAVVNDKLLLIIGRWRGKLAMWIIQEACIIICSILFHCWHCGHTLQLIYSLSAVSSLLCFFFLFCLH